MKDEDKYKPAPIIKSDGTPLMAGDVPNNKIAELKYEANKKQMVLEKIRDQTREEIEMEGFNFAVTVIKKVLECYDEECPDAKQHTNNIREMIDEDLFLLYVDG